MQYVSSCASRPLIPAILTTDSYNVDHPFVKFFQDYSCDVDHLFGTGVLTFRQY